MIKETTKAWHKAQTKIQHGSKIHLNIFLAWCEGKRIQSKRPGQPDSAYKDCITPAFVDTMCYRVKPQRLIPTSVQFFGYWSNKTQVYFTTSKKMDTWDEKTYPRKPELDHTVIMSVLES